MHPAVFILLTFSSPSQMCTLITIAFYLSRHCHIHIVNAVYDVAMLVGWWMYCSDTDTAVWM